jgi:serine/threonine protein kinase
MALERLTSSKHVVNVYGYCSTSAFFEFSDGGDIYQELWSTTGNITSLRKLQIATQAAMGLADAHTVDFDDRPTIAHTDVAGGQYILIDGVYKLNDFNRARFLLRNKTTGENCPYVVGKNPGKNRSPEEYRYDPQTEKVDVYSFGNILYTLVQMEYPFQDVSSRTARERVMSGYRPSIYVDVWNSTDPAVQAIKEAMILCHVQDPKKRVSMRQVERLLKMRLEEIDPGRLQMWGDT